MPLFLLPFLAGAKSFISAALAFFSKPPGVYIGIALALVLSLWWFGQHEFNRGKAACESAEIASGAKINKGQVKILEKLRTVYVPAEAKIKTVTKTIIKEVPVYVTKRDDAACTINNGFVRLHDAAAKGELPSGSRRTDGEPSGVDLSTVGDTIASNYGTCHLAFSRLSEWQDWYRQNKTLWDQK